MRGLAKVAAVAASTAVAAEAFGGDVWGYTTFDCSDEIVVTYDTVEEACRDPHVTAYVDRDDGFLDCKSCNDVDDDDEGSGGGGGAAIVIGPPLACGWDQIADSASGRCVLRPFDDNAKALAARVGNCGAPTVAHFLNNSLVSDNVSYGLPEVRGHYGSAGCGPKGNNPPTTLVVKLNRAALEKSGRSTSSAWHWASVAVIHEFIHVRDYIEYDSCAPWYTLKGLRAVTGAGYPSSLDGFEGWTDERTNTEYLNTFGFMSPEDRRHVAAVDNKPLPCLFD